MGRIVVHLHGLPSQKEISQLIKMYQDRLKSKVRLEFHPAKSTPAHYISKLPPDTIYLDEGGAMMTSAEFSQQFNNWTLATEDTHLAIGPADGFPKGHGKSTISLSPMTMPHELAALILVEQLYRAFEINRGSSYHRV
jgi:23S rRNA (pseudouridine1915-N3)-methyltransferase